MATRKFLTSVADVWAYDTSDNLVFTAKTLLDTSIEVTTNPQEVRGGRGSQLLYTYYSGSSASITLTDAQFNLQMLGSTVGSTIATGNDVYTEQTVTLDGSGAGTVTGTPIALPNSGIIYGWVSLPDGSTDRVTFTGSAFTTTAGAGNANDVVCVRYWATDSASRSITVPASILPSIVRLELEAQLNSSDEASNKIGVVQILVPKFSLSGAFTISMTSDGVANTPLSGMAYASADLTTAACSNEPIYMRITEVLDSAFWYSDVIGISVEGGNFSLATTTGTKTLVVYAVKNNGDAPFIVDNADLNFTSATAGVATAGLHTGLITGVSAGTSLLSVVITNKTSIEIQCTVTVPS